LKPSKRLYKLLSWAKELNKDSDGVPERPTVARYFAQVVSLIVTGLTSSVVSTWIAQDMLNNSFPAALVIGMVFVLVLATALQVKGLPFNPKPLQIIAFLLTLVAVQSTIIAYIYISNRPLITYLVFDATESTIPYYGDLVKNIRLTAQVQHPKSLGGLRIYGGQASGQTNCRDTIQLIAPTQAKDFEKKLDEKFGSFDPKGNASLTTAVKAAVSDDLKYFRGAIKLIVITSGIDPDCEPRLGGIFEDDAERIRAGTSRDITIAIIGVGDLTSMEETTLRSYARSFDGTYLNASKPAELNSVILAPPNYFLEYEKENGSNR